MRKTAIVLFNLGGPSHLEAVKPFLFNLFNDPAILRLPTPFRQLIAKLISGRREKTAQEIYSKMGGCSPILQNTQAQAKVLEEALSNDGNIKTFIAMRYWHPFVEQTVQEVAAFAPDEIILLPLYPQFSTTTTASSLKAWKKVSKKAGLKVPEKVLCCYPQDAGFISTIATDTLKAYESAKAYGKPRLLFSAHGLPEKIIKAGDPYQWQCEQTAAALVKALNIDDLDWVLCYQSRVGPLKWITPATDSEIKRAGHDKTPLIIVPIAFVSEHSETLVEIDMEYRQLAREWGVPFYSYVPTVGTSQNFIEGLASLVRQLMTGTKVCQSGFGSRLCPTSFLGCCNNKEQTNVI